VTTVPERPKLYHITHVENLDAIAKDGFLLSDRGIVGRGGPARAIGMTRIKERRINELEVDCHAGTKVGDYVPFYFCPRSVMLYVIYCRNHEDLTYRGGQERIVHLEADLRRVVRWADEHRVRWAFSLSNAGARYAEFRDSLDRLCDLEWGAIEACDFRDPAIKEGKQAEFLLYERFPFELVEQIGVHSTAVQTRASRGLTGARHRPVVELRREWYY